MADSTRDRPDVAELQELRDLDQVNRLLNQGWVLIDTHVTSAPDGPRNETVHYVIGWPRALGEVRRERPSLDDIRIQRAQRKYPTEVLTGKHLPIGGIAAPVAETGEAPIIQGNDPEQLDE